VSAARKVEASFTVVIRDAERAAIDGSTRLSITVARSPFADTLTTEGGTERVVAVAL